MKKDGDSSSFFHLNISIICVPLHPQIKRLKNGSDSIDGGDRREALQVQGTDPRAHFRVVIAHSVLH